MVAQTDVRLPGGNRKFARDVAVKHDLLQDAGGVTEFNMHGIDIDQDVSLLLGCLQ